MMFTLFWKPEAEEQLAAIWLSTTNRKAVTHDAHEIELLLEQFPGSAGEVSFDTVRVYTYGSLTVEYEVYEEEQEMLVMDVWNTADGRPDVTGN